MPLKQEHMIMIGIVVVLCVISLVLYMSQPWRRRPLPAATAMKKMPMPVPIPRMNPTVAAAPRRVEPMPPLPRMQPSSVGRRQNHDDMMGPSTMAPPETHHMMQHSKAQAAIPVGYHMMPDGRVMKDSDHDIPHMQPSAHPGSPHNNNMMGPSTMTSSDNHHAKAEHEPVSSDEEKHRMELMRGSMVGRRAMIAPTTSALMMGAINTRENSSAERGHGSSAVMDRHLSLPKSNGTSTGHPQPYGGSSSGASTF
jgi:hypothetical protein